jgi:hypothetical protein
LKADSEGVQITSELVGRAFGMNAANATSKLQIDGEHRKKCL